MQGAAFGFGLIVGLLIAFCQWQSAIGKEIGRHRHSGYQRETQAQQSRPDDPGMRSTPKDIPWREQIIPQNQASETKEHKQPCDKPAGREEDDTCSQFRSAKAAEESLIVAQDALREARRQADYALGGLWIGGVGALATALAAWAAAVAARAAAKSNEISHQAFIADQRAWICVSKPMIESDVTFINGRANIIFSIEISNTGKTPATNIYTQMEALQGHDVDEDEAIATLAAKSRVFLTKHTRAIVPGEQYRRAWGLTFYGDGEFGIYPTIIGCVTYVVRPSVEIHQTLFSFDIYAKGEDGEPSHIKTSRSYQVDDIIIINNTRAYAD
jgi:hypothetical protein